MTKHNSKGQIVFVILVIFHKNGYHQYSAENETGQQQMLHVYKITQGNTMSSHISVQTPTLCAFSSLSSPNHSGPFSIYQAGDFEFHLQN